MLPWTTIWCMTCASHGSVKIDLENSLILCPRSSNKLHSLIRDANYCNELADE